MDISTEINLELTMSRIEKKIEDLKLPSEKKASIISHAREEVEKYLAKYDFNFEDVDLLSSVLLFYLWKQLGFSSTYEDFCTNKTVCTRKAFEDVLQKY